MSRLKSRHAAQDESSGSVFDEKQSSTGVAVDGSALPSSNMTPSFSSPEKTPSERTRRPNVEPPLLKGPLVWRYIGVKTRSEAEEAVKPPTEFRLYHQWEQTVLVRGIFNCDQFWPLITKQRLKLISSIS
ncbi:unnamed protein product [Anisakis simplex]|uniref:Uncharacterized protein n=1 Tax=Anisakis simplex TaxID=6269 RepID=A0A0M3KH93_ANISI|nr:unnamed protein product [Anisakis simplex]